MMIRIRDSRILSCANIVRIVNANNFFLRFAIILFMIFIMFPAIASPFMPLVRYFSLKDYKAGNQNWSVAQDRDGIMYFGNTNGLLSYDGYHWILTPVPGTQIVRSVYADGKRIYVGSFEEFGYFNKLNTGELKYHSVSALLKRVKLKNDEIWKIVKVGKNICFQSFKACFIYDGKKVSGYHNPHHIPLFLYSCYGKMYVQLINEGFSIFDGRSYREIIHRSQLNNSDVIAAIPYCDRQILLITKAGGIFIYLDGKLNSFVTKIDAVLNKASVNRAVMTRDKTLIIGTISDGVYALRMDGSLVWHFNRLERLNNNTVLGLCCDADNDIWVALDDGIAYIQYNSPLTLFSPQHDKQPIGMVYSMLHKGSDFYLGTNQGIYRMNAVADELKMIPNSADQNWYLNEFDGQIFGGSNNFAMNIINNKAIPIPGTTGSTCIKRCTINGKDILLNVSYVDLNVFVKNNFGKWVLSHKIKGFSNPIKNFEVDQDGSIWLSHMYKGAYHLWLTDDLHSIRHLESIHRLSPNNSGRQIRVMKIQGNIVLADEHKLYIVSNIRHQIVSFNQLNQLLPNGARILGATEVNNHLFWLVSSTEYILIDTDKGSFRIKAYVPFSNFDNAIHSESLVFVDQNGDSYFNLNNGIARYDASHCNTYDRTFKVRLGQVRCTNNKRESILLPLDEDGAIKPNYREISIELLIPHYNLALYRIHYYLKGAGINLESDSYDPVINYSSLDYGSYQFTASVYNDSGQRIGMVDYQFTISRPFLISWFALFIYFILLGLAVYYIAKWRLNYLMKKGMKEHEAQQAQQKLKMHEQELLIAEQNKKLLESKISVKSKELASMAMGLIAKNSMLEELRTTIQEQTEKGPTTAKFMHRLLTQINENIENKEFWDVFQQNFDLIHTNFFRNLRERYPDLTPTDLRFCALFRLNLTTKDIAQIDNLSVRGVEAARYRIRKKLNIPEGTSLVDFMIDLK
jgi:ligand-binding sensor domain-containing protein/DNA-binding CsgD family transcriptional regulator